MIFTIAFGTKGAGTAAEDDWAAKWKAGKKTLSDAGGWFSAGTFQTPLDANVSDPNMETSAANNTKSDDECKAIQPRYAVAEDHTPHLF